MKKIALGLRYLRNLIAPSRASRTLIAAADLIAQPGAWTQKAYARDAEGEWVGDVRNPTAVSFCITGAMERAGLTISQNMYVSGTWLALYGDSAVGFNDRGGRTQEEVVAAAKRVAKFV